MKKKENNEKMAKKIEKKMKIKKAKTGCGASCFVDHPAVVFVIRSLFTLLCIDDGFGRSSDASDDGGVVVCGAVLTLVLP